MEDQLATEAERWLTQMLNDLSSDSRYQKDDGEALYSRAIWELGKYTPELQEAVHRVLGRWLSEGDDRQTRRAHNLVIEMGLIEFIPIVARAVEEIRAGHPRLPGMHLVAWEWLLSRLERKRDQEQGEA